MKFSNDALVLMAHICNPRRYALPERMRYQWFLSQFYAAFAATIESSSSSLIPLTSDVDDDDSKIYKAPNDHQDKAVKECVLLDRAKEDKNSNAKDNVVDSVSFVLKELDLGRLAVQKTVEEETNCLTYQDSEASTNWLNHCASSVGPYLVVDDDDDDDDDASAETEPCPYGSDEEENFYSLLPSYSWDSGAYFPSSQEEDESAYGYSFNEDVRRELDPEIDCNNYDPFAPKPDSPDDYAWKLYDLVKNCHIDPNHDCPTNVPPLKCWDVTAFTNMRLACSFVTVPADVSFWDFSKVTYAGNMFYSADLSNLDLSKLKFDSLKDMNYFFSNAKNIGDISAFDVSRITSATAMFREADLSNADMSNWKFDSLKDMSYFFYKAKNIGDISAWDLSRVTKADYLFEGADLANADISNWKFDSLMSLNYAFERVDTPPQGLSSWDVSHVNNMRGTFFGVKWNWNADAFGIAHWDVSQVTDMQKMFGDNAHFPSAIWRWDVGNVKQMGKMFYKESQSTDFVEKAHLQMWDFHKDVNMDSMFGPKSRFTNLASKNDHDLVRRLCSYFDFLMTNGESTFFSTWHKAPDDNGVEHIDCYCPNGDKRSVETSDFQSDSFESCIQDTINGGCPDRLRGSQPGCWDMSKVDGKIEYTPFVNQFVPGGVWGWDITNLQLDSFFVQAKFNEPLGIRKWKMKSQTDQAGSPELLFNNAKFGKFFDSVVIDKAAAYMFYNAFTDDGPLSGTHNLGDMNNFFFGTSEQLENWSERQIKNLAPYIRFTRERNRREILAEMCPANNNNG